MHDTALHVHDCAACWANTVWVAVAPKPTLASRLAHVTLLHAAVILSLVSKHRSLLRCSLQAGWPVVAGRHRAALRHGGPGLQAGGGPTVT